jgi:hypothetical protein
MRLTFTPTGARRWRLIKHGARARVIFIRFGGHFHCDKHALLGTSGGMDKH